MSKERIYEFHITANEHSIKALSEFGIPIIGIAMLDKDGFEIQRDWMTTITKSFHSQENAISYLGSILQKIQGTPIFRVKIETPYEEGLDLNRFKYIETHNKIVQRPIYYMPTSKNIITEELIETHRCYNVEKFERFAQSYGGKVELCVMDTNIQHDYEWFKLY
jgi:hypothetical protein